MKLQHAAELNFIIFNINEANNRLYLGEANNPRYLG